MTTELKPMTYLLCANCGERIPYDKPRVVRQIWKGGQLLAHDDLCIGCESK